MWFYTNIWANEIVPVEIEKYTDNSVWVGGRRRARRTTGELYAPTWDEAHLFLTEHWNSAVLAAWTRVFRGHRKRLNEQQKTPHS